MTRKKEGTHVAVPSAALEWVWRQLLSPRGTHVTPSKRVLTGCGSVLLCGVVCASATAQDFYNYKTSFTFDREVELPGGRTLQPGTYLFRLVDSSATRYIVQVLDTHETHVFATMLAVEPRDETVIFGDAPINAPRPIRYWYHAGDGVRPIGYEFVYPTDQATRIANVTQQRVLMTDVNVHDVDARMRVRVRTVDPNGAVADYREHIRPRVRSTYAAATSRELDTPVSDRSDVARTEPPPLAAVQSITLMTLTLLGAALAALHVHRRTSPRPLERPLGLGQSECAPGSWRGQMM